MKDVVDKCSTKGCAIDIGTVIDNDNCTSKFSRFFATREEAESFMTKLKELAAAASSADEGASVAYKIKDLEGQVELDAAFTFSCQAEMIIFELSLMSRVYQRCKVIYILSIHKIHLSLHPRKK